MLHSSRHAGAEDRKRAFRRAASLTIGVGVAHVILFLLSRWIISMIPGPRANDPELLRIYSSASLRCAIRVGLYVMSSAGITCIWFIAALH
jgi:hypothetical protein